MSAKDELTAGLQAELDRVNARLALQDAIVGGTGVLLDGKRIDPASIYAEQPAVWSLNVDELAIYRDGKRFAELDEGNSNDSWREALRAGSEIVRLLNAAHGITKGQP